MHTSNYACKYNVSILNMVKYLVGKFGIDFYDPFCKGIKGERRISLNIS